MLVKTIIDPVTFFISFLVHKHFFTGNDKWLKIPQRAVKSSNECCIKFRVRICYRSNSKQW